MLCPRCNKNTLEEREKEGVTIDICQECRGIWLDRGELERLIARATREMDKQTTDAYAGAHQDRQGHHDKQHGHHDDHHKNHGHDGHHGHEGTPHRKRHWLAELFD